MMFTELGHKIAQYQWVNQRKRELEIIRVIKFSDKNIHHHFSF